MTKQLWPLALMLLVACETDSDSGGGGGYTPSSPTSVRAEACDIGRCRKLDGHSTGEGIRTIYPTV